MEVKTYGIKTHLVEEFKQFKISRHKREMAFLGNCTLLINAIPMRSSVRAANGVISINPFPLIAGGLVGFPIPPQHLNLEVHCCVPITLHSALQIFLIFDADEQKMEFIAHLNLAEHGTSSSDETDKSASSNSNSNASQTPTTDSGFENVPYCYDPKEPPTSVQELLAGVAAVWRSSAGDGARLLPGCCRGFREMLIDFGRS
ncbi:hypothetical protein GEV33_004510 [Tenebrio molitor]|uniref:Uncharacterized protein n=1 Tax=Tenebrio molitor TaxID=7067 RepID=A0A8J6HN29_TENMO|nr:hypothetical protein GEV33_004510 [Tenebrio molitor]